MLQGLNIAVGIVSLLCYFFVIYQMFDKAESFIAIICLVGICVFGLGGIVAFIYGWIKAREWEIVPVMAIWSGCVAVQLVIIAISRLAGG